MASARNPFYVLRDAIVSASNRAYYASKIRDSERHAEFVLGEIEGLLSPSFIKILKLYAIRDIIGNPFEKLVDDKLWPLPKYREMLFIL